MAQRAASAGPSTSTSAGNSRPETETEDNGDVDMDASRDHDAPSPSPERQHTDTGTIRATHSRRAVGIVTDTGAPAGPGATGIDLPSDAHIIINDEGVVPGVGVEDGIVSLETNDDFVMSAPPELLVRWTDLLLVMSLTVAQAQASGRLGQALQLFL